MKKMMFILLSVLSVAAMASNNDVSGVVYIDHNNDCTYNEGDDLLSNWKVYLSAETGTHPIAVTDANGFYHTKLTEGSYSVHLGQIPHNYAISTCVDAEKNHSKINLNFPIVMEDPIGFSIAGEDNLKEEIEKDDDLRLKATSIAGEDNLKEEIAGEDNLKEEISKEGDLRLKVSSIAGEDNLKETIEWEDNTIILKKNESSKTDTEVTAQ